MQPVLRDFQAWIFVRKFKNGQKSLVHNLHCNADMI